MEKLKKVAKNKIFLFLSLIILLAFSLRIASSFLITRLDKDSVDYILIAKELVKKDFRYAFERNPRMPPLYFLLMAAGEKSELGAHNTGVLISLLAGALLPLAAFLAARALFKDDNLALIAALLAAVHPYLIRMSVDVMRDSLFCATSAFAFAFALSSTGKGLSWKWFAAGFFAAMAVLARSEGIEIAIVILLWCALELFLNIKNFKTVSIKVFLALAVFLAAFSIFSFPVQYMLKGSCSRWQVIDHRIVGYIDNFLHISKKEVIIIEND